MSSKSKVTKIESYRAMIGGVQTNVGATQTIAIRGVATAQPVIVGTLQGYVDAADAASAALAAYHEAVAKQKSAAAAASAVYLGVKAYALAEYGNKPTTLETFGLQVPVRKTPTAATKAAAVAKRKAKRTARGTTGNGTSATTASEPAATPATAPGGAARTTTATS
jgi:hypothetical protein